MSQAAQMSQSASNVEIKRVDFKQYVHYGITLLLVFGSQFMQPIAPVTQEGMAVLGVFLGAIYGWSTIGMLWPSIIGILGLGIATDMRMVLAGGFGNDIVAMLILLFTVIALLNELKLLDVIAGSFITNKFTLGKPWLIIYVFLLGMAICGVINGFAAIVVFITILCKLCTTLGYKPYSPFVTSMMVGLALATILGQVTIPFKGNAIPLVGAYNAMTGEPMNFAKYMLFMIPMTALLLGVYVLIMRFILRIDVTPLKQMDESALGEKKKLNSDQRKALTCFLLIIGIFVLPNVLPKTMALTIFLKDITMFGQVSIILAIMLLMKKSDGTPFLEFGKLAAKGISWECIFMTALIMPISGMLTAESTGIKPLLAQLIAPMTELDPMIFVVVVMLFATVVTNFAQNVVLAIIIMPVIFAFATQVGLDSVVLTMVLIVATNLALLTPGASAYTAIAFSYNDWIKPAQMMKYGMIAVFILFVVMMIIGMPFATMIFGA